MTTSEPTSVQMNASTIYVPNTNNIQVTVYVMADSDESTATALQELVDLLQTWSGRDPLNNVTGTLYGTTQAVVLPADAVIPPELPDPQPDPNG